MLNKDWKKISSILFLTTLLINLIMLILNYRGIITFYLPLYIFYTINLFSLLFYLSFNINGLNIKIKFIKNLIFKKIIFYFFILGFIIYAICNIFININPLIFLENYKSLFLIIKNIAFITTCFSVLLFFIINIYSEKTNYFKTNENKIFTNQKHNIFLLLLFIYFVIFGLITLLKNYIGTDEANTLYVLKLLKENFILYKDFWYREPLAIYLFLPFQKITDNLFINLRLFVLMIHFLLLITTYAAIKKIYNKNMALLFVFIYIFFNNIFLKNNWGLFNIVWFLFFVVIISTISNIIINNITNYKYFCLLGGITGISILIYKASLLFLTIIPVLIFIKYKKIDKKIFLFLLFSFLPILLFLITFSYSSSFSIIYSVILKNIIQLFILILLISLTGKFLLNLSKKSDSLKLLINNQAETLIISFVFIFFLLYQIINFIFTRSLNNYWPLLLESSFVITPIFILNILFFKNKIKKIAPVFLLILIFFYGLIILKYYGTENFFNNINFPQHILLLLSIIIYFFSLIYIVLNNIKINFNEKQRIILIVADFFLLGVLLGSTFMESRYKYLLYLFPFVILGIFQSIKKLPAYPKILIIIATFISIFTANKLNENLNKSDYTLYSVNEITHLSESLELKPNDKIFTGDVALASIIKNENLYKSGSPLTYRGAHKHPFYWNEKLKSDGKYIHFTKKDYADLIIKEEPKYILGSFRLTFKTFFNIDEDKNNLYFRETLNNYIFLEKRDHFDIYINKKYLLF